MIPIGGRYTMDTRTVRMLRDVMPPLAVSHSYSRALIGVVSSSHTSTLDFSGTTQTSGLLRSSMRFCCLPCEPSGFTCLFFLPSPHFIFSDLPCSCPALLLLPYSSAHRPQNSAPRIAPSRLVFGCDDVSDAPYSCYATLSIPFFHQLCSFIRHLPSLPTPLSPCAPSGCLRSRQLALECSPRDPYALRNLPRPRRHPRRAALSVTPHRRHRARRSRTNHVPPRPGWLGAIRRTKLSERWSGNARCSHSLL